MVIYFLIIGIAAGFLATRFMKVQTDVPTTIAIGLGGALIGGLILRTLIVLTGAMAGLVGAILGALALIWAWNRYMAGK
jgi:uncharacterized membrane protein YeaQ/YmgE (transglycosylase-associated protein family)